MLRNFLRREPPPATEAAEAKEPSDPSVRASYGHFVNEQEAARIERMAVAAAEADMPPWAAVQLRKAAPLLGVVGASLETVAPIAMQLGVGAYAIVSRLPKNQLEGLWGLGICFYGGRYAVTIACVEAFRATGGDDTLACMKDVWAQLQLVRKENEKDDQEDADGDGTADVRQLDPKQLLRRKTRLVLRTIDPEVLGRAISGIWSGYMGVLAVVKFKFAKTVALAHSIGDSIRPMAAKIFAPTLLAVLPPDYHKWANPILNFGCKVFAGFLAWKIQYCISTVQSGFSGGLCAAGSFLPLVTRTSAQDTMLDEIIGYSLAACGIYFQFRYSGLPVPFFVKPAFWPLDLLEWWLQFSVTWIAKDEVKKD